MIQCPICLKVEIDPAAHSCPREINDHRPSGATPCSASEKIGPDTPETQKAHDSFRLLPTCARIERERNMAIKTTGEWAMKYGRASRERDAYKEIIGDLQNDLMTVTADRDKLTGQLVAMLGALGIPQNA